MSKELKPERDMWHPTSKSLDFIPWMTPGDGREPLKKVLFEGAVRLCGVCLGLGPPSSPFTLDLIIHYLDLMSPHSSQMMLMEMNISSLRLIHCFIRCQWGKWPS